MNFLPIKISGFRSTVINQIIEWCRSNQIINSPDVIRVETQNGTQLKVIGVSTSSDAFSPNFHCKKSGSTVTVSAGNIDLHDIDSYAVAETSVVLSGETEWVFVWHMKDHSASGIDHQASVKPKTDGNMWRWPLAKYVLSGTSYTQEELCREYDISESNPLR